MAPSQQGDALLAQERQVKLHTGPLVPLLPPKPAGRQLPPLPARSSSEPPFGSLHDGWKLDTFIVPAAFPRSAAGSTQHPAAAEEQSVVGGGRIDVEAAYKQMLEAQLESNKRGQVSVDDKEELAEQEQLHIAVNRYQPRVRREGGSRGLTLVFAHANGFHKGEPCASSIYDNH